MMNWIMTQNVVFLAFLAGLFTWGCTILGSAVVFFFTKVSRKLLDIMMGFAAGVMIAASFWSLLDPALAYAKADYGNLAWVPAAVGVTFGALASGNMTSAALIGALGLAIGIGLQNIPEGAALSIPIRADGSSRFRAFFLGAMSAIVEPIGAVLGAALVIIMLQIIPYALAYAAGAMMFVVVEELIPESQTNGNTDVATLGLMVGFVIMMVMDVALG